MLATQSVDEVKCVIFDLDGLLINSEHFYEAADKVILQALGRAYSVDLEWKLRGRTALDCAKWIVEYYKLDITPEDWNTLVKDEQSKMFPSTRPMPGMIKILHHLYKNKIPMAIATSCTFKTVAKKTDHLQGMISYFRHIVSLSDPEVTKGKTLKKVEAAFSSHVFIFQENLPQTCFWWPKIVSRKAKTWIPSIVWCLKMLSMEFELQLQPRCHLSSFRILKCQWK